VVKPLFGEMGDKRFLLALRVTLIFFTAGVLMFALNNTSTMYEMVQNAYKVTLVGAFVPLVCGIYWHRASTQGALVSSIAGLVVWGICEKFFADADIPPQMVGLFASFIGILAGSYAPQLVKDARHGTHVT
jgi:Na+/proline symporter